jgi:hypothetical protein
MTIIIPLAVMITGLFFYVSSTRQTNAKPALAEIGRIMFFCGLLAFLLFWPHVLQVTLR